MAVCSGPSSIISQRLNVRQNGRPLGTGGIGANRGSLNARSAAAYEHAGVLPADRKCGYGSWMPGSLPMAFHNQPGTPGASCSQSATTGRLHVLADGGHGLGQFGRGAEFDHLGVGEAQWNVSWSSVVHVAGRVRLVMVG